MYAVDSIQIRMKELGLNTPAAPTSPKAGWNTGATSGKNTPAGTAYAPPKYRAPIAKAVYTIPIIPRREKGARDARFFSKQSGKRIKEVIPIRVLLLVRFNPTVEKRALKVSAKIMEYDKVAKTVIKVQLAAGITLVSSLIVFSHASRYEFVFVYAQTRPIKENEYPDKPPIPAISTAAGTMADGAFPKAAIPTQSI